MTEEQAEAINAVQFTAAKHQLAIKTGGRRYRDLQQHGSLPCPEMVSWTEVTQPSPRHVSRILRR